MSDYVIIPAYNEEKHIQEVVRRAKDFTKNVIVVDDGSRDYTPDLAKSEKVMVLKHAVNMGKGAALKTGCDYALQKGAKRMVVLDADGQHDPAKIPEFLESLNEVDLVFGYRQLGAGMPLVLRFGNWFINKTTKVLYGLDLRDTQSGYRAFTAEAYQKMRWQALDYSMESEMICNAGREKLRYKEIPISTIYADKYKGTTVVDGVKIVIKMMLWRLRK